MRNLLLTLALSMVFSIAMTSSPAKASAPAQIEPGDLTVCPDYDAWAMSVWTGPDGTSTRDAIEACPAVAVSAVYWLDNVTQTWLSFDPNAPDVLNSLTTLNNLQPLFLRGESLTLEIAAFDDYFSYEGGSATGVPLPAEQQFTIIMSNNGSTTHNIRVSGADMEYGTSDDLLTAPYEVSGGGSGTLSGKLPPGTYKFRCDFHIFEEMFGSLVVQ